MISTENAPTEATVLPVPTTGSRDRVRVLLVDDQPLVRMGLKMRLELEPDMEIVGEAGDGKVSTLVAELRPDVVVMDVAMPGVDGIQATALLAGSTPGVAVVILTLHDNARMRGRASAAGARGFVGKHQPEGELLAEIRRAAHPPQDPTQRPTGTEG